MSGSEIISLVSTLAVLFLGIWQISKWRAEARELNEKAKTYPADASASAADASKKFAEASQMMAQQNIDMVSREVERTRIIQNLEAKVERLENKVDELANKVKRVVAERDSYHNWAQRLVKQLYNIAPHIKPTPYKMPRR
jgi:uncharacterized coiled-coil DUF342 family protein